MSYAYLFKYIIIGNTGKLLHLHLLFNPLGGFEMESNHYDPIYIYRCVCFVAKKNDRSGSSSLGNWEMKQPFLGMMDVDWWWWCRSREIMPSASVHGQEVSAGAWSHHRCWVWGEDDHHRQQAPQTPDLGYRTLVLLLFKPWISFFMKYHWCLICSPSSLYSCRLVKNHLGLLQDPTIEVLQGLCLSTISLGPFLIFFLSWTDFDYEIIFLEVEHDLLT